MTVPCVGRLGIGPITILAKSSPASHPLVPSTPPLARPVESRLNPSRVPGVMFRGTFSTRRIASVPGLCACSFRTLCLVGEKQRNKVCRMSPTYPYYFVLRASLPGMFTDDLGALRYQTRSTFKRLAAEDDVVVHFTMDAQRKL